MVNLVHSLYKSKTVLLDYDKGPDFFPTLYVTDEHMFLLCRTCLHLGPQKTYHTTSEIPKLICALLQGRFIGHVLRFCGDLKLL